MILPPYDKCLHFVGGQGIAFLAMVTFHHWHPYLIALAAGVIVGVGKEVWDYYHPPHKCEGWDALATILGAVSAILVGRFL